MISKHKILIIDDDRAVCSSLQLLLQRNGYTTRSIYHPSLIIEECTDFKPNIVLLDMNFSIDTSGKQGLKALTLLKQHFPAINIILMTGWSTVQLAVEGMKLGAKDFIAKPWDNHSLLACIKDLLSLNEDFSISKSNTEDHSIIGQSPIMQSIIQKAIHIAQTDASVLITGESGTGKELLAELIHNHSKRHDQSFVKVNLGGISYSLFESELFGHKKGAFTGAHVDRQGRFEVANKGTIFLDEIGELELSSQVKLLRVLQEKTFEVLGSSSPIKADVRVISATNRDLSTMIQEGKFREDLFYRINLIHFHLPPIRERREDIPLLVDHFINTISASYDLEILPINPDAMEWLTLQSFSGNIRQLKNVVERTLLMNIGEKSLTKKHFEANINALTSSLDKEIVLPEVGKITLEELEIKMIQKALQQYQNSVARTARALGLTRSALYRRLEKYKIDHESQN